MNRPSLDRFEPLTKPNGSILVNSSMVDRKIVRADLTSAYVQATRIAEELGTERVANMVVLGAFVKVKPVVQIDSLITCMNKVLSERWQEMRMLNEKGASLWF